MFLVVDNFEDGSRKHFLTSEFFKEHCVYCTLKTLKESYDKHVHKYIIDITSNKESSLYKRYERKGLSDFKKMISFYKGDENYIFIDYKRLFEKVEFLPESKKIEAYETQDAIKDFLKKTITKASADNGKSSTQTSSKALEAGIQLNNIIPHKKPFILVERFQNIPEDQNNSDYITMDEIKILSSVHLEVLMKLKMTSDE